MKYFLKMIKSTLIMDFNNKWAIIIFSLLIFSVIPLFVFFSFLFSGKLNSDQSDLYSIYAITIYVVTLISAFIIVEYKIHRPREAKNKSNEIDSSIHIFRSIYLERKTLEIIQTINTLIIIVYIFDVLIFRAKYAKYLGYGIGFIPLIINVLLFMIINYSLTKQQKYKLHWAWNIFILISLGSLYFGHAYSWNLVIPDDYLWAGPAFVIIVFIVGLLDMKRMSKVPFGSR